MSTPCGTLRRRWEPTVDGDVAWIPLTRGRVARIDACDLPLVAPYAWAFNPGPHTGYAVTHSGRRFLAMHRLLTEAADDLLVDHIDLDGLNNQRSNLRLCTKAENSRRRRSTSGTSQFKGVAYHRASGLHHATINVDGRQLSLGYYRSPEDAARAYDAAAVTHFGSFSLTNKELGLL